MSDERERTRVDDEERTRVDDEDFEGHKLGEGRYDEGDEVDPGKVGDPGRFANDPEGDDFEGHQLKVTDPVTDKVSDI